MRILIFGINYAPELTGIGKYTGEMSSWLSKHGHHVEVVTAFPYYPDWQTQPPYRGRKWLTEILEGVKVHRHVIYVPNKVTSLKRVIHEFSFLLSTFPTFLKFLFRPAFDIVVCVSPPFHLGLYPLLYSKIRRTNLVTHIQDLQVDAAKDLKMITSKVALNIMFRLEKLILNHSRAVSTISTGMINKIAAKGVPPSKILFFPNWVDETAIVPISREQSLRREFGIAQNKRVILYSGNLGEKQGLEVIVDVARGMAERSDVIFVIVGSGGGKQKLVNLVSEANLSNVVFFPLQPYEKLSQLLAIADLHLVLQKKSASDLVLPSKLTAILASGGCAIVTASPGTSLFDIIAEHDLGIIIEPESASSLLEGINTALKSDLTKYQSNARTYSEKYLSKESVLRQWEINLLKLTATSKNAKTQPAILS